MSNPLRLFMWQSIARDGCTFDSEKAYQMGQSAHGVQRPLQHDMASMIGGRSVVVAGFVFEKCLVRRLQTMIAGKAYLCIRDVTIVRGLCHVAQVERDTMADGVDEPSDSMGSQDDLIVIGDLVNRTRPACKQPMDLRDDQGIHEPLVPYGCDLNARKYDTRAVVCRD